MIRRRVAALTAAAAAIAPAPVAAAVPTTDPRGGVLAPDLDRPAPGDDLGGPHRDALRLTAAEQRVRRWRRVVRPYRAWLASVRACESGSSGGYAANTGNGFHGAYQFTVSSWRSVGGRGLPHLASPLEQDVRAVYLLRLQGPGAWPNCA